MKTLVLAALLCAVCAPARAETAVSGFNPRFRTAPAYPDEPDYRPANRPRHTFEFMIDASPDIEPEDPDVEPEDEDDAENQDRRRDRHDRRRRHR